MNDLFNILKEEDEKEEWCIVRYQKSNSRLSFCGPLGFERIDETSLNHDLACFPRGKIAINLWRFPSQEEAEKEKQISPNYEDLPTNINNLYFRTTVLDNYNGKSTIVYDGGSYYEARKYYFMWLGIKERCWAYLDPSIECVSPEEIIKEIIE